MVSISISPFVSILLYGHANRFAETAAHESRAVRSELRGSYTANIEFGDTPLRPIRMVVRYSYESKRLQVTQNTEKDGSRRHLEPRGEALNSFANRPLDPFFFEA